MVNSSTAADRQLSSIFGVISVLIKPRLSFPDDHVRVETHTCFWFTHTHAAAVMMAGGRLDPLTEKKNEGILFKAWPVFRSSAADTSKMQMNKSSEDVWIWLANSDFHDWFRLFFGVFFFFKLIWFSCCWSGKLQEQSFPPPNQTVCFCSGAYNIITSGHKAVFEKLCYTISRVKLQLQMKDNFNLFFHKPLIKVQAKGPVLAV